MVIGLITRVAQRDQAVKAYVAAAGGKCVYVEEWLKSPKGIPVLVGNGNGCDEVQKLCRKHGWGYVYIDHAYWKRGYHTRNFRFCLNNYHCTDWRETSNDRFLRWKDRFNLQDWKGGDNIIVLPPSPKVAEIYNAQMWCKTVTAKIRLISSRNIIVKPKDFPQSLQELLRNAHCVVSFGSVADVESALAGVPLFTSEYSPAAPIALQDFTKIENPITPDRMPWLKSLCYAQWNLDEIKDCVTWHLPLMRNFNQP